MTEAILLHGVSSLLSVFALNDSSAEQETAGITLRMTTTFPKFQWALWPKKIG